MDTFGGVRATNGVPSDSAAGRVIVKTENAKAPATWVVATAAPRHATGYHNLALIWRVKKYSFGILIFKSIKYRLLIKHIL